MKEEMININANLLDEPSFTRDCQKGDLIHVFGYFKEREKEGKKYRNFLVKSYNKIEKKEENEED